MKVLLRKAAKGHNNLFEWSPNGKTWYPINYDRIQFRCNENHDEALKKYREAMNQILAYPGFWIHTFRGSYNRSIQQLTIKSCGDKQTSS